MNCKLCHEPLISSHQLACGHSFCLSCIQLLSNKQKYFHCPTCKKLVIQKPIENIDLNNFIDEVSARKTNQSSRIQLKFNNSSITKQNSDFTVFLTPTHPKKQDFHNLSIQAKFTGEGNIKIKVENEFVHEFVHNFNGNLLSIPFGPIQFLQNKFGQQWRIEIEIIRENENNQNDEFILDVTNPKGFGDAVQAFRSQLQKNDQKEPKLPVISTKILYEQIDSLNIQLIEQNAKIITLEVNNKKLNDDSQKYKTYSIKLKNQLLQYQEQFNKVNVYRQVIQQQKHVIMRNNLVYEKIRSVLPNQQHELTQENADKSLILYESQIKIKPKYWKGNPNSNELTLELADYSKLFVCNIKQKLYKKWEQGFFDAAALTHNGLIREIFQICSLNASVSVLEK